MSYAKKTKVSIEKSANEIQRTVLKYGAESFATYNSPRKAGIEFSREGKRYRFTLELPDPNSRDFTHNHHGHELSANSALQRYDQECRRMWRALALVIKAKLEAVHSGISTVEKEFMAQIVLPNGKTAAEELLPQVQIAYETGRVPALEWGGK